MQELGVELWHLVTVFFTLVFSVFKEEIKSMVGIWTMVRELKTSVHHELELNGLSSGWERVTLLDVVSPLPLIRRGGIRIALVDEEGKEKEELISFASWKTLRVRHLSSGAK